MTKKIAAVLGLVAAAVAAIYFTYLHPASPPLPAPGTGVAGRNFSPVDPKARAEHGTPGDHTPPGDHRTWICPMHPEIQQDHPGTCPICGMKLVEVHGAAAHEHSVHVDSATIQSLGIRLATVKHGAIAQEIQAYGNVVTAENTTHTVHSRYDGWIKKLYVHAIGESVKAGQVLYEIYSPDLITRERAYLSGIDRRKQVLQTIPTTADTENQYVMDLAMDAAADRAKLHVEEGVSVETIQLIEDRKQPVDVAKIVAGNSGAVTQINVREGAFVSASMPLLTLADVSRVWLDVTLYPDQVGMVKVGDPVTIQGPRGASIKARLDFIAPLGENNKVHARIYLDNAKLHLRPGTFADVAIGAQPHEALVLPRSAVLYTAHASIVMLSRGDGHFLPTPVETGSESGDSVEIISGLREGAEVAANGQFLLDSASALDAAAERLRTQQP